MTEAVEVGLAELRNKVAVALMGVSDDDIITEYQHISFDDGKIIATDTDRFTVRLDFPTDFEDVAVRGEGLHKFLELLGGESVFLELTDHELLIAQNKSEQKLAVISIKEFLDPVDEEHVVSTVTITERLIEGLGLCLKNVEKDNPDPYRSGITCDVSDSMVRIYSTNNESILEFDVGTTDKKVKIREVMPAKFARALITATCKLGVSGQLEFGDNHIAARLDECYIFTPYKSSQDIDFKEVMDEQIASSYVDNLVSLCDSHVLAFQKQMVCGPEALTTIQNKGDVCHLHTSSNVASVSEELTSFPFYGPGRIQVAAHNLLKYKDQVDMLSFEEGGVLFHGTGMRYMVAYV